LLSQSSVVPRAPYDYHIRSSSVILRFDGYRGPVHPRGNVLLCLLTAANNVNMHFGSTEPISTALQTRWGRVRVKVIPSARNELTWEMWGTAIRGITEFVTTYV